jgi:hypothetical protein
MNRVFPLVAFFIGCAPAFAAAPAPASPIHATRVGDAPIITEQMLAGADGESINGPSLIRVPSWVANPLGRYYLYFAHHAGKYLRLAVADEIAGPWRIVPGGVQPLDQQTVVVGHIASPEVVVDEAAHRIWLFYHGNSPRKNELKLGGDEEGGQITGVSSSADGLHFEPLNRAVGPAYLRVFAHGGRWYALNQGGRLLGCEKLGDPFKPIARMIGPDISEAVDPALRGEPGATPRENRPAKGPLRYAIRHVGLDVTGDRLYVYFSCAGHRPERILATCVDLQGPPANWRAHGTFEVLRPERPWEGGNLPLAYSRGGISLTRVNELRDPTVFREGDSAWLVYSTAGEHGLGLASLHYAAQH